MKQKIVIKSFNGIGDLLFVTPTLRCIKESYPDSFVIVNTNRMSLLENNPFVDVVDHKNEGVFLSYPAPDGGIHPTQHHIQSDWEIVSKAYGLKLKSPILRPELFIRDLPPKRNVVGVQVLHKGHYHKKRIWPHFEALAKKKGFEAIPFIDSGDKMKGLVKKVAEYKCVVCGEGGVSHIAAAIGTHAIVLFGGFTNPVWVGYPFHVNFTSDVDCKYCFNLSPCGHNFKCWEQISIDKVEEFAQ